MLWRLFGSLRGSSAAVASRTVPDPPARNLLLAVDVAFGQVITFYAYRWSDVTGGEDGFSIHASALSGAHPQLGGNTFYFLRLVVFVVVMFGLWYL